MKESTRLLSQDNAIVDIEDIYANCQESLSTRKISIEKNISMQISDYGKCISKRSLCLTLNQGSTLLYCYKPSGSVDLNHEFVCLLHQDSVLYFIPIIEQEQNIKLSIQIQLVGKGAQAYVHGYYTLNTTQRLSIATKQHHQAAHSISSLALHGVLTDQAMADYRGSICIDESAAYTNAVQSNKTLLFDNAQAVSEPFLEANNNQVQAQHGSAIGKLNDDQLFYLQSKGLSLQKAQAMIIESFKREVFAKLPTSITQKIQ